MPLRRRPGQAAPSPRRLPKNRRSGPHPKAVQGPDDIPLALRTHSGLRPSPSPLLASPLPWVLAGLFLLAAGALVFFGPLRQRFQPPPVPGLDANLSQDGRLLGHFPYPEAKASELVSVAPGLMLRQDAAERFLAMHQAAAADGVALSLLSAFRPVAVQKQLFFAVKAQRNQSALDRARVSAPPGFSEHSTGYAIDLGDLHQPQANLSPAFAQTAAYRWLTQHAARYQFALSFPRDNPQGVNFEPWHWRYEGSVDALRLFEPAQRLQRQGKS